MKATQTHAVSSPCQRRLGAALKHKLCANVTLNFCSLAPISFCAWIRRELRRLFCQIWNLCWSEKCQPLFVPVIAVTAGFLSVGGLCGGAGDLCLVPPLPSVLLTLQGLGTPCRGFSPLLRALSWMLEWQVAGSGLLGVLSLFCLLFSILKLVLPLNYWLCALQHEVWHFSASHANKDSDPNNEQS